MKTIGNPNVQTIDDYHGLGSARLGQLVVQAAFREGLLESAELDASAGSLVWTRGAHRLQVPGKICAAEDRIWVDKTRWAPELEALITQVRLLADQTDSEAWRALILEITEGLETQKSAYSVAESRKEPSTYLDFEAWTPEGHNLHPGAKTRKGFSSADQFAYGPEFADFVMLPWLAVSKELMQVSGETPPEFELDKSTWRLPVHPWQLENVIPELYREEWERGQIRTLNEEPARCRLCTSLRTVVPENPKLPVLKTSVGSLMTSTERSMSRYTVLQGPIYTEYFERIQRKVPSLFQHVKTLREFGGFCFHQDGDSPRSRNLSLLFRQRPPTENGLAVPCSALPQPTWGNRGTYIGHFFGQGRGPLENFQRYLELLIPFHIRLYLQFGLALEAHLQNCVVVWRKGAPVFLWVRDWGGLRVDAKKMNQVAPDLHAKLDPRSVTLRDADAAEKKLIACLYCNHITELVAGLEQEFELPGDQLWAKVRNTTVVAFHGAKESTLRKRILDDAWPVKCLLKMRLGLGQGDLYRERPNPLLSAEI